MNPLNRSDVKAAAGSAIIAAAALVAAIVFSERTITLLWDNAPNATVTDVWASTNLTHWRLLGSVTNRQHFTVTNNKPAEFFRVSHRYHTDGETRWLVE